MTGIYLRLVLAMLIWGGTFVFAKTAGSAVGEIEAATWRFLVSALLLTPLLLRGHFPRPTLRELLLFGILGLSGIYLYNLCFFYGLQLIEAGHAGLIIAANPVVVLLLAALLLKEPMNRRIGLGVALSVVGAMLLVAAQEAGSSGSTSLAGVLLIVGCVLCWAVYSLVGKLMMSRYSPAQLIAVSVWAGASMLVLHLYVSGGQLPAIRGRALFDILYLAVLGTVLSFVWFYDAVDRLGAGLASQFVNLVPISAVFFGYLMLGERLSFQMLAGGVLVISGVLVAQRARQQLDQPVSLQQ